MEFIKENCMNNQLSTSLYRIALLIIAGIETNPGPRPPKYPCSTCSKACKGVEKALACDECDTWYHASCTGINTQEYSRLANSSVSWYCMICDAPNLGTPYRGKRFLTRQIPTSCLPKSGGIISEH
jgi:hypothetical protein